MIDFTVSDQAAKRIKGIISQEPEKPYFRVRVDGGGCSGFQYIFSFEENRLAEDLEIKNFGASVLIDPVSISFLEGSSLEFKEDLSGSSFIIKNPNASLSCGCGNSFSL
jgi:iron-sulfur cluster assembly accessory protein